MYSAPEQESQLLITQSGKKLTGKNSKSSSFFAYIMTIPKTYKCRATFRDFDKVLMQKYLNLWT